MKLLLNADLKTGEPSEAIMHREIESIAFFSAVIQKELLKISVSRNERSRNVSVSVKVELRELGVLCRSRLR